MICPNCKYTIEDSNAFCTHCGAAVKNPLQTKPPSHNAADNPVTTMLSNDHSDFRDTVVDEVIAFDPLAFDAEQGDQCQQSRRVRDSEHERPPEQVVGDSAQEQLVLTTDHLQSRATQHLENHHEAESSAAADPSANSDAKRGNILIGILSGAGVLAALVAVIVSLNVFGAFDGLFHTSSSSSVQSSVMAVVPSSSVSPSVPPSSSTANSNSSEGSSVSYAGERSPSVVGPGDGKELSESKFYELLVEYYDLAGSFDRSVSTCADDFNSNYLKEDKGARSSCADKASNLKSRIKGSWDSLKKQSVPFMSKNTQAYREICELYECLWHRIDVIDRAWKIDLQYSKPADHQSEITEPIDADRSGKDNKYYTRFKELYPRVKLVAP